MQNKNKIIIKSINIAIKTAKCQVGSVIAMLMIKTTSVHVGKDVTLWWAYERKNRLPPEYYR